MLHFLQKKPLFAQIIWPIQIKAVTLQAKKRKEDKKMQATTRNSCTREQTQPMCGLDYALADIAAGRINHYSSLEDLIQKFE